MTALAVVGLVLVAGLAPIAPSPARAEGVVLPPTLPAIQQWRVTSGTFVPRADLRIVVPSGDAEALGTTARLLAADLAAVTDLTPTVQSSGRARTGDILLDRVAPDAELRPEGYRLEVGSALAVEATGDAGVFYGTRSVVQMLRQQSTLPRGVAVDWPRYRDRGLMIDAGRRYYPPAFYRRQIEQMSYLKMNLLHLHISDEAGLGIESERHPETVQDQFLTKAEVADLVAYARDRHIRVMPEIDMPGHMAGILEDHPELQLRNAAGIADPSRLDVTNPAARAFARDLVEEFLPLFPDAEWHLGADEYLKAAEYPLYPGLTTYAISRFGPGANGKDAVHDFVNTMAAFLRGRGKTVRIWNDDAGGGSAVELDPRIVVEWWTDVNPLSDPLPPTPQQLVDDGHEVLNNGWWPTYYGSPGLPPPDFGEAYEKWEVHDFYGVLYYDSTVQAPPKSLAPDEPKNRGSKLAIWSDGPFQTDEQLLAGSLAGLRLIGQRTWGSPSAPTYDAFLGVAADVGEAPSP